MKKKRIFVSLTVAFLVLLNMTTALGKSKYIDKDVLSTIRVSKTSASMTWDELLHQISKDTKTSTYLIENNVFHEASENQNSSYRILEIAVPLYSNYKPTIKLYCQTSETKYYHGIIKILCAVLDGSDNDSCKIFSGTIYANLEAPDTIYCNLNGDFYNHGTTVYDVSQALKQSDGQSLLSNYKISNESDYFSTNDFACRILW